MSTPVIDLRARKLAICNRMSEVVDVVFHVHKSLATFRAACINAYILEGSFYLAG